MSHVYSLQPMQHLTLPLGQCWFAMSARRVGDESTRWAQFKPAVQGTAFAYQFAPNQVCTHRPLIWPQPRGPGTGTIYLSVRSWCRVKPSAVNQQHMMVAATNIMVMITTDSQALTAYVAHECSAACSHMPTVVCCACRSMGCTPSLPT